VSLDIPPILGSAPLPQANAIKYDVSGVVYNKIIKEKEITLEDKDTCDFCSNEWVGFVRIDDQFPWVCETHWKIYAD